MKENKLSLKLRNKKRQAKLEVRVMFVDCRMNGKTATEGKSRRRKA